MKYFKVKYENGDFEYHKAETTLELIQRLDLCTKENIGTRVIELEGEQRGIAIDYLEN